MLLFIFNHIFIAITPPALPPLPAPIKPTAEPRQRTSKLEKLGNIVKEGLLKSNSLRREHRLTKKANEAILSVISESSEGDAIKKKSVILSCRKAARKIEDVLFSVGGAERIVSTLRYFKDRPAVREVSGVREALNSEHSLSYYSKEEKMNALIVKSLRGFLEMFQRVGGGRRSNEDQNAYDSVMAALNNNDLTGAKLGRMLSRTLNVSHRQVKRGRALRDNMEDMDKKRWIRKTSAVPKNAIGEGATVVLYDYFSTTAT